VYSAPLLLLYVTHWRIDVKVDDGMFLASMRMGLGGTSVIENVVS
jgi:hypothetical protein